MKTNDFIYCSLICYHSLFCITLTLIFHDHPLVEYPLWLNLHTNLQLTRKKILAKHNDFYLQNIIIKMKRNHKGNTFLPFILSLIDLIVDSLTEAWSWTEKCLEAAETPWRLAYATIRMRVLSSYFLYIPRVTGSAYKKYI